MSTVIAERRLDYFSAGGSQDGAVRVFAPEDDGSCWTCRYHIEWPGFSDKFYAAGEDSLQALTLALQIIPVKIQVTDDFKAGRIGQYGAPFTTVVDLNKAIGTVPLKGFDQ